jgi:hypothetical protein
MNILNKKYQNNNKTESLFNTISNIATNKHCIHEMKAYET